MTYSKKGTLIVIAGPTGSGKTDLSIELALRLGSPVISFDSRQVFRGMSIGTAQPSPAQLKAVKHYFIADRDIHDNYTSGLFEKEALELLTGLFSRHEYVIAVGGSGLYMNALCHGLDDLPSADRALRLELEEISRTKGLDKLLEELKELDPAYYDKVDRNNSVRIIRALEICRISGRPYSAQRKGNKAERDFNIIKIGINCLREELYERINLRVDLMMEAGLEEEARTLYPHKNLNSLQTVGYRELFDYFDGGISYEEAVSQIKMNSRRYAKRQLTWFRRDEDIKWFEKNDIRSIENLIKKFAG